MRRLGNVEISREAAQLMGDRMHARVLQLMPADATLYASGYDGPHAKHWMTIASEVFPGVAEGAAIPTVVVVSIDERRMLFVQAVESAAVSPTADEGTWRDRPALL